MAKFLILLIESLSTAFGSADEHAAALTWGESLQFRDRVRVESVLREVRESIAELPDAEQAAIETAYIESMRAHPDVFRSHAQRERPLSASHEPSSEDTEEQDAGYLQWVEEATRADVQLRLSLLAYGLPDSGKQLKAAQPIRMVLRELLVLTGELAPGDELPKEVAAILKTNGELNLHELTKRICTIAGVHVTDKTVAAAHEALRAEYRSICSTAIPQALVDHLEPAVADHEEVHSESCS